MTVATEPSQIEYIGNAATTVFPMGFRFIDDAHITVTVQLDGEDEAVAQVLDTDFTLTGAGLESSGTVVFEEAPAAGASVIITRDTPMTQPVTFAAPFSPEVHEAAMDRTAMVDQELARKLDELEAVVEALDLESNAYLVDLLEALTETVEALAAVVAGLVGVISGTAEDLSIVPDVLLNATPALLLSHSLTVPDGGRTVLLEAAGSLYTVGAFTFGAFGFYIKVNGGAASSSRTIFFANPGYHANWSGSWLIDLPAGAVTIELYGVRTSGTSTGTMNADDSVHFTFIG